MSHPVLYYVHDPMCSWCWGFRPTWQKLQKELPDNIRVKYLLGGLAADNDQPMPDSMRRTIQATWKQIQHDIPGTQFNFDFWEKCIPRRSTYPACRAILAARKQKASADMEMLQAIQECYYLKACNPSNIEVLIQLSNELNLDVKTFKKDLISNKVNQQLEEEILLSRQLGVDSFPAIVINLDKTNYHINIDYLSSEIILDQILALL